MLKKLIIEQFVIIDRLEIDFQPGLTIITGDTGAGKSILLDAIGHILGEPADINAIRHGSEKSVFEAVFTPPATNAVWRYLYERGLTEQSQQEFTVRRTIHTDGTDEILISGKPISLEDHEALGEYLAEIHGQFANQSITDPENQMTWLDLSGNYPPEVLQNVSDALDRVNQHKKELEEEKVFLAQNRDQAAVIENYVKKFESVEMNETLVEDIHNEYDKLITARDTTEAFQAILAQFVASQGVIYALKGANATLESQENLDEERVADLRQHLADSLKSAHSALNEMRRLLPEYEIDTSPLHECERVLNILYGIAEHADVEVDDLYQLYLDMVKKLERIRNGRARIKEIEGLLIDAKRDYNEYAKFLTEQRIEAGASLDESITKEFGKIKLNKAEFCVIVEEKPDMDWTKRGYNTVTYSARMNPGMPFSPISETASGGELARMILALKVVLQSVQTTPTLVFDEVDTGIGGAAAIAVGERIARLAQDTQVLVITHSPQVASCGNQHMHVSKSSQGDTTTSAVRFLSPDERINEIARMLAGDEITTESHAAAKRLIEEANSAASRPEEEIYEEEAEIEAQSDNAPAMPPVAPPATTQASEPAVNPVKPAQAAPAQTEPPTQRENVPPSAPNTTESAPSSPEQPQPPETSDAPKPEERQQSTTAARAVSVSDLNKPAEEAASSDGDDDDSDSNGRDDSSYHQAL